MSLADALERAASALPDAADAIRDANGDADRVLEALPPQAAAGVLAWLLTEDAEAAAELADAWSLNAAAGPVLDALDEAALGKPARKLLRKTRHRLRSRGVTLAESAPPPRVARPPGGGEEPLEAALVSPYDPTGARMVTVVEANPSGGARIFQVITDARRGILECRVYGTSRGKARRFARELETRERFGGVEAPPAAVRAWLGRCSARQAADRSLPREFAEWRSALTGDGPTPGALAREALGGEASARGAVELIRERTIGPWLPAGEPLREVAEKLQELEKGTIIVSGGQKLAQIEEILDGAIDTIFDEDEAARVAEWLDETAYLLWKQDRDEDARACLAAGSDREVRRTILEVALEPVLARLRESEQEREADSLVVKP